MERPGSVQFYESIENEIKSKIPELTGAMDVATWLLIYHVDVEQKGQDVATGGAAQIALAVLMDDACCLEWPPCSTLLARLTAIDTCVEVVARLRASGRAAPVVLLVTMLNPTASTHSRIQAAEAMVNMLEHSEVGTFAIGCLQGAVLWGDFRDVLNTGRDVVLKGCVARVAMHLLSKVPQNWPAKSCFGLISSYDSLSHQGKVSDSLQNEALVASVKSTGIIGALLTLAAQSRRDKQLESCFGCLAAICADRQNWSELIQGNLLRLATDVLGPPPPGYVMWEFYEHQLWRVCGTPKTTVQATCAGVFFQSISRPSCRVMPPSTGLRQAASCAPYATVSLEVLDTVPSGLLSVSTLAVPSTFNVSVRTQRHVVTCLNYLLQDPGNGFLTQLSDLRAAYRLAHAMQTILASDGDAGSTAGGKGKKKGPVLDSDQVNALAAITGVLKILTINAACAFRVARTGCLPMLLLLKDHSSLPLRRNCQMILSHTAYLRENQPYLKQLEMPEEYLTGHQLRLTDGEAAAVAIDFADVQSTAAQLELQIHGHLFNMSAPEAQKVADEAAAVAAREA